VSLSYLQIQRGQDLSEKDIGAMAAAMAENLDEIEDDDSDFDADDAPIFTPELALLKAKESG